MATHWTTPTTNAREPYERDGYLSPVDLFDDGQASRFRDAFDALERREGKDKSVIDLKGRHVDEPFIWEMATHPRLLDWMQALIGENLLLLTTHFFCKYPGGDDGHFVAWHQDIAYWGLEPANAHTAWIAIDDSDLANGCMEVVPGSHRAGVLAHGKADRANNLLASNQAIEPGELALDTVRPLTLRAGQMSVHHGALAHASQPNRSARRRCGLTVRFITPEVRQVRPSNNEMAWWQPVLVRGRDTHGHFANTAPNT